MQQMQQMLAERLKLGQQLSEVAAAKPAVGNVEAAAPPAADDARADLGLPTQARIAALEAQLSAEQASSAALAAQLASTQSAAQASDAAHAAQLADAEARAASLEEQLERAQCDAARSARSAAAVIAETQEIARVKREEAEHAAAAAEAATVAAQAALRELEEATECTICNNAKRDTRFFQCGHLFCAACGPLLEHCPNGCCEVTGRGGAAKRLHSELLPKLLEPQRVY